MGSQYKLFAILQDLELRHLAVPCDLEAGFDIKVLENIEKGQLPRCSVMGHWLGSPNLSTGALVGLTCNELI